MLNMCLLWSNRRRVCLIHSAHTELDGGGRALKLIQSEEGKRSVFVTDIATTRQPQRLYISVQPTHNRTVTVGALCPFFFPSLHLTIVLLNFFFFSLLHLLLCVICAPQSSRSSSAPPLLCFGGGTVVI